MLIECLSNAASFLDEERRTRGSSSETTYEITAGRKYQVVALLVWENSLNFLVRDDDGWPMMAPAGLFEVGDWDLPPGWRFRSGPGARRGGVRLWEEPLVALWGYAELVEDPEGLERLFEDQSPEAMALFESQFDDQ